MALIHPDFARRIDLPGVGPCPRPIDIDQARTGFSCLVSLRVYAFAQAMVIDGEAEGDEVYIVAMRGCAEITVSREDRSAVTVSLDGEGGQRVVYMPPHASYRLTASGDCDIAYARVAGAGPDFPPPRGFGAAAEPLDIAGYALSMDLTLVTAQAGSSVELGQNGGSGERFIHVRSGNAWQATIAGQPVNDWDAVALAPGEPAVLLVEAGTADVLTICAVQRQAQPHLPPMPAATYA